MQVSQEWKVMHFPNNYMYACFHDDLPSVVV